MGGIYFPRHTASGLSLVLHLLTYHHLTALSLLNLILKITRKVVLYASHNVLVLKSFLGIDLMIKWVVDYFTPKQTIDKPTNLFESLTNSPVTSTNKMPLILQHNGHSRTIIGYEIDGRGVTNLLMFDPA
jgi:hypothetical protein